MSFVDLWVQNNTRLLFNSIDDLHAGIYVLLNTSLFTIYLAKSPGIAIDYSV